MVRLTQCKRVERDWLVSSTTIHTYDGAMIIAVIGGDPAPPDALALAEEVGKHIALHRATLICGGRGGVMEAACKGATDYGGEAIGVLPDSDKSEMTRTSRSPSSQASAALVT